MHAVIKPHQTKYFLKPGGGLGGPQPTQGLGPVEGINPPNGPPPAFFWAEFQGPQGWPCIWGGGLNISVGKPNFLGRPIKKFGSLQLWQSNTNFIPNVRSATQIFAQRWKKCKCTKIPAFLNDTMAGRKTNHLGGGGWFGGWRPIRGSNGSLTKRWKISVPPK